MHTLALSNQKGGCGKTRAAINIAASLAGLGHRTLLVDLDPQAHATFGLGIQSEKLEHSMYNVLTARGDRKKEFIEDVLVPVQENLDLAPAHVLLSIIEQEFTNKEEGVSRLRDVLASVSFRYAFVVIDCPPSLGFLTFNALRAADTVIVPIEMSSFSLMGVGKLLSMIELIRVKLEHSPRVFALSTMVDMRTRFARHMDREVRRAFGDRILNRTVAQAIAVRESQAKGAPLGVYAPRSKSALEYLELTKEILGRIGPSAGEGGRTNGRVAALSERLKDFSLEAGGAKEVYLVGDFNNWGLSNTSLLWRTEDGRWQKRLHLEPGRYRYKFVIDGHWVTDPSNDHLEPNPYGGVDSVLEID